MSVPFFVGLVVSSVVTIPDFAMRYVSRYLAALNINLLEPLAQGASRFEKSLAPQNSTGPQFFSNNVSPSKTVVDIKTLK